MEKIVKNCFYILKQKEWFLIKEQFDILEDLLKDNCDIDKINDAIININNVKTNFIKFGKLSAIIRDKNHYSYKCFLNFLKELKKYDEIYKEIKQYEIQEEKIYFWFLYTIISIGGFAIKENLYEDIGYNMLWNRLKNIIQLNLFYEIKDIKQRDSVKVNFSSKIAETVLQICIAIEIFTVENKFVRKEKINIYKHVCKLNKKFYEKIIVDALDLTIKLPYLKPIKLIEKENVNNLHYFYSDSILISSNSYCSLNIKNEYLSNLEYLQAQALIINQPYLEFLLNCDIKKIKELTDNNINLEVLFDSKPNLVNKDEFYRAIIWLTTIYLYTFFQKHTLYISHKCDNRGRIYQENWPINVFYTKIFSPLFLFKNTEFNLNYSTIIGPQFDTHYWEIAFSLNPYKMLSIRDATASMFQIIGGLVKDEQMLKYTNFYMNEKRLCIYIKIKEEFEKKIQDYLEFFKDSYETIYFKIKGPAYSPEEFMYRLNNLERSFIKMLVMPHGYNQGVKESCSTISKYFFGTDVKILYKLALQIYKIIFSIFDKLFPKFKILKVLMANIVKENIKNNQVIALETAKSFTHKFFQAYKEISNHRIYIRIKRESKEKKVGRYYIKINEEQLDSRKNVIGLLPNYVQYLDSVIATQVITECKAQNIPILINHDCFFTTLNHDLNVLNIYNKVFFEIILNTDNIWHIILINNCDKNLKIINCYKKLIKKNFNEKTLDLKQIKFSICA